MWQPNLWLMWILRTRRQMCDTAAYIYSRLMAHPGGLVSYSACYVFDHCAVIEADRTTPFKHCVILNTGLAYMKWQKHGCIKIDGYEVPNCCFSLKIKRSSSILVHSWLLLQCLQYSKVTTHDLPVLKLEGKNRRMKLYWFPCCRDPFTESVEGEMNWYQANKTQPPVFGGN